VDELKRRIRRPFPSTEPAAGDGYEAPTLADIQTLARGASHDHRRKSQRSAATNRAHHRAPGSLLRHNHPEWTSGSWQRGCQGL